MKTQTYKAYANHLKYKNKNIFIIWGEHINGNFSAVINKNISIELSYPDDKFYNSERFSEVIKSKADIKLYTDIIADYKDYAFDEIVVTENSFDFNGYNFLIITGSYFGIQFFIIPNWNVSGTYSSNVIENTKTILKLFKKTIDNKTAEAIATAIASI